MTFLKELIVGTVIVACCALLFSHLVAVPTDSMNPTVKAGDIVLVEKVDVLGIYEELDPKEIKKGDIIVFENPSNSQEIDKNLEESECIIHRVVEIHENNEKKYLILKGDNNSICDDKRVYLKHVTARAIQIGGQPIIVPKIGYIFIYGKKIIDSIF